jgi:hypothetical protein
MTRSARAGRAFLCPDSQDAIHDDVSSERRARLAHMQLCPCTRAASRMVETSSGSGHAGISGRPWLHQGDSSENYRNHRSGDSKPLPEMKLLSRYEASVIVELV